MRTMKANPAAAPASAGTHSPPVKSNASPFTKERPPRAMGAAKERPPRAAAATTVTAPVPEASAPSAVIKINFTSAPKTSGTRSFLDAALSAAVKKEAPPVRKASPQPAAGDNLPQLNGARDEPKEAKAEQSVESVGHPPAAQPVVEESVAAPVAAPVAVSPVAPAGQPEQGAVVEEDEEPVQAEPTEAESQVPHSEEVQELFTAPVMMPPAEDKFSWVNEDNDFNFVNHIEPQEVAPVEEPQPPVPAHTVTFPADMARSTHDLKFLAPPPAQTIDARIAAVQAREAKVVENEQLLNARQIDLEAAAKQHINDLNVVQMQTAAERKAFAAERMQLMQQIQDLQGQVSSLQQELQQQHQNQQLLQAQVQQQQQQQTQAQVQPPQPQQQHHSPKQYQPQVPRQTTPPQQQAKPLHQQMPPPPQQMNAQPMQPQPQRYSSIPIPAPGSRAMSGGFTSQPRDGNVQWFGRQQQLHPQDQWDNDMTYGQDPFGVVGMPNQRGLYTTSNYNSSSMGRGSGHAQAPRIPKANMNMMRQGHMYNQNAGMNPNMGPNMNPNMGPNMNPNMGPNMNPNVNSNVNPNGASFGRQLGQGRHEYRPPHLFQYFDDVSPAFSKQW